MHEKSIILTIVSIVLFLFVIITWLGNKYGFLWNLFQLLKQKSPPPARGVNNRYKNMVGSHRDRSIRISGLTRYPSIHIFHTEIKICKYYHTLLEKSMILRINYSNKVAEPTLLICLILLLILVSKRK